MVGTWAVASLSDPPAQKPSSPRARRQTIDVLERRSTIRAIIGVTRDGGKQLRV